MLKKKTHAYAEQESPQHFLGLRPKKLLAQNRVLRWPSAAVAKNVYFDQIVGRHRNNYCQVRINSTIVHNFPVGNLEPRRSFIRGERIAEGVLRREGYVCTEVYSMRLHLALLAWLLSLATLPAEVEHRVAHPRTKLGRWSKLL